MKTIIYSQLNKNDLNKLIQRPAIKYNTVIPVVTKIINEVKKNGDIALKKFNIKFDKTKIDNFKVTTAEINNATKSVSRGFKKAVQQAYKNIYKFHKSELIIEKKVKTNKGIICWRENKAIESVGLYIPGGTAILPSTVLMLATPAKIADCKNIILCTPPKAHGKIAPEILYIANFLNLTKIYKVGGAQAIAAMAYGTKTVQKVNKIFGPGNQYVTAAKMLISIDPEGCAIDMPAGPSEVLVIADKSANSKHVAADLLSQAEHGTDSQVILVTDDIKLKNRVEIEVKQQAQLLGRIDYIEKCLTKSLLVIVENLKQGMKFANNYAPEHMIINTKNADYLSKLVQNAGSVFIGPFTPESAGDYASGTNHSLPTYGYAKSMAGVSTDSFIKKITFQKITKNGLKNLRPTITCIARVEGLEAHAQAAEKRFNKY